MQFAPAVVGTCMPYAMSELNLGGILLAKLQLVVGELPRGSTASPAVRQEAARTRIPVSGGSGLHGDFDGVPVVFGVRHP
jgi:hypothetical protein